jgi:excisionase family DNA binding protein
MPGCVTTAPASTETLIPEGAVEAEVVDFVAALQARGLDAAQARPQLIGPDGVRIDLPEALFHALRFAAEALSRGQAISIAPRDKQLTTMEAAEFLGMSRPTLIKFLERGDIPFHKVGRHRRVILRDLITYQRNLATVRRKALQAMVDIALEHDLYESTSGGGEGIR